MRVAEERARAQRRVPRRARDGPRRRSWAPRPAPPTDDELRAMVREVEAALDAGAFGLSTGLIYAPGMHAAADELEALVATAARRGGLYATHMRNECAGLFESLDESIATIRAARALGRRAAAPGLAPQVRRARGLGPRGRGRRASSRPPGPRASTSPPTSTRTRRPRRPWRRSCRPACSASASTTASRRSAISRSATASRPRWTAGSRAGRTSPRDPGWAGIRISFAPSHPDWAGRSLAELGEEMDVDPADLAFDALIDDRLDVSVVIDCMDETDVETIMAVPWIAVCTDAEGRRPGPPDPRRRPATPADVREHGPGARHVRARARHALARDGRRQAQRRARRAPRPARPGRGPRGRLRRPRRVRPGDRRRRRDVRAARAPSGRHRARHRQRAPGGARRAETGERAGRLLRRAG